MFTLFTALNSVSDVQINTSFEIMFLLIHLENDCCAFKSDSIYNFDTIILGWIFLVGLVQTFL